MTKPIHIAIVKLSALGDIVHAMVALQFVKAALPDCRIDWVVEQRFAEVLAGSPDIDRVITVNLKALKTNKRDLFQAVRQLKAQARAEYDWVIDAQGLLKSALVARLLSKNTVGFDKHSVREKIAACLYRQGVAYPYDGNTIDRNVTVICQPLSIAVSHTQIVNKQAFLFYQSTQQYFTSSQPKVLLVIGSTWPSRNYPKENFLQVIKGLPAEFLICWGSEQEKTDADWLVQRSSARCLPKLTLNELKAAIDQSDLVIGNDTGPTHMAWGLNKASITLFGPTPVSRVYQTNINQVLKSPSLVNPFKLDKNDYSIAEIPAQAVLDLAKKLLENGATGLGMLKSAPQ